MSQISRDYIQSQPDKKNIFLSLDRKHLKTLKKRAHSLQVDTKETQEIQDALKRLWEGEQVKDVAPADLAGSSADPPTASPDGKTQTRLSLVPQ